MATEAIIADQILDASTVGKDALKAANAGAFRTVIGAGTSSFDGAYSSLSGVPSTFTPAVHEQAWSTITSTPTTLSGYGITDALTAATAASTYLALAGGTVAGAVLFTTNTQLQFASSNHRILSDNSNFFAESSGDLYVRRSGTSNFRVNMTNATTSLRGAWAPMFCITSGGISTAAVYFTTSGTDLCLRSDSGTKIRNLADSADADLSCRSLTLTGSSVSTWQTYSPVGGATATLLLGSTGSNLHRVTRPTSGNITIAFSGDAANQVFLLVLATSGSGTPGTVTWPAGLTWLTNAGVAPTISTAINKTDSVMFLRTGAGAYLAWHTGQN